MAVEKRVKVHCSDIEWDTDGEDASLPQEKDVWIAEIDAKSDDDTLGDLICDLLASELGFCIKGLRYELGEAEEVEVNG